jgi:hypothetical protein
MPSEEAERLLRLIEERRKALLLDTSDDCLVVSVVQQTLDHFRSGKHLRTYKVSTARAGVGCVAESLCTPTGLHRILERIGAGALQGMVFKARVPTGTLSKDWPTVEDNLITTRILRLDGLEAGYNKGTNAQGQSVDTHSRFVYIHGTNQAAKLGQPNSHGCILLSDDDVTELFEAVPSGTLVYIA